MSSCKHRSPGENEEFYQEGLVKLRAGNMEESTGKLIKDLMEIRAEKALLSYARQWIKHFPNHEVAPRLVGRWLEKYKSNDAMYLARSYVRTYPDLNALGTIVVAAGTFARRPAELFDAIEKRMAKDPNSYIWGLLQHLGRSDEIVDKLVLTWIGKNKFNPEIVGSLSSAALFTSSKSVLEATMQWAEHNQGKTPQMWMVLIHLLRGKSDAHHQLLPLSVALARNYVKNHSQDECNGFIYRDLLIFEKSEEDVASAKAWYQNNEGARSAASALRGILQSMRSLELEPDIEIIQKAKRILKQQPVADRSPAFVNALLLVCPDHEVISLAKETGGSEAALLRIAPDSELIAKVNNVLATSARVSPELIIEVLKIDQTNTIAVSAAKNWMQNNSGHEDVETIKSLLPAGDKPKRKGVQSKRKA